jgi:hypothetical protein
MTLLRWKIQRVIQDLVDYDPMICITTPQKNAARLEGNGCGSKGKENRRQFSRPGEEPAQQP